LAKKNRAKAKTRKWWKKSKYVRRRKVCAYCSDKFKAIDYKDVAALRSYISDRGRTEPRRKTGLCAKHQHALALAVKRARHLVLLPYVSSHIRKTGGVGLN
jgi:small subunit ribosomal protein S18